MAETGLLLLAASTVNDDDVEAAVDELTANGVSFERYDGFDQDERGIDRSGPNGGIAWFKDPAGNILAVHGELTV